MAKNEVLADEKPAKEKTKYFAKTNAKVSVFVKDEDDFKEIRLSKDKATALDAEQIKELKKQGVAFETVENKALRLYPNDKALRDKFIEFFNK